MTLWSLGLIFKFCVLDPPVKDQLWAIGRDSDVLTVPFCICCLLLKDHGPAPLTDLLV